MIRGGGAIHRAAQRGASFVEAMILVALAIGAILVAAKILGGQQKETSEVLGQHIQTLDNQSRDSNSTGTAASPGDTYAATNATCDSTHGCDGATPPATPPPTSKSSAPPGDPAPPASSPGALDYAGSFAKGFFVDGVWGTVVGVATAVRHPVDTATGLYNAASHPVDTYNAVKGELADAWAKDPSRVIGGGIFQALTIVGPGALAKVGTVAKVGELTAEAGAASKLSEASTIAKTAKLGEVTSSATAKAGEVCEGGVCTKLGNCFAAGTPVLTPDGERPIEDVAVGDVVLARDPETGETKAEHVVQLFVTPDRDLVDLAIEAAGTTEHLKVTGEHPFFTQDRGFVAVNALVIGEHLQTALGEGTVVSLASLPERATVFNFEVEEAHTYFVGHLAAWVHNECRPPDLANRNGWHLDPTKDADWRGQGKTAKDALAEAFARTGVPKQQFEVTKWGTTKLGKSAPVEWRSPSGAEVNMDIGHTGEGPGVPHVGYQTPGKRKGGGGVRGHILLDDVPANR